MVSILFVGGIKTQGALEKSHLVTSYNVSHQGVGNRPPMFPSSILEDSAVHAGRQKSAENFPHVSICSIRCFKQQRCTHHPEQSLVYHLHLELMCFLKTTKYAAHTWHSHSFGLKKASFIFLYKKVYLVCVCT